MPSAQPPVENGPPKSELEELQIRANQVTDEVNFILIKIFPFFHSINYLNVMYN